MPLWLNFSPFLFSSLLFLNMNIYIYILYICQLCLSFITIHNLTYLTECENLQNLDGPFRFLFEDFCHCSCFNNINYRAQHVYKRLFGYSVATCRLACYEFHFRLTKKAREKFRKWLGILQIGNHGVTTSAQLRVLYPYRVRMYYFVITSRWTL